MKILLVAVLVVLGGCGGQARIDYYNAIAEANRAEAAAYQAKAAALRAVAEADPSSSGAVAMALALSSSRTVAPAYVESDAVTWGKILASPVSVLGSAYIAADVAKAGINANKEVQMASQQATASMVTGVVQAGGASTNQAVTTLGGVIAGQGDNLVTVATQGLESTAAVANSGLATADSISANGLATVDNTVNTLGDVSTSAINSNTTIASEGLATTATVATEGMNLIHATTVDNNATIVQLSETLQPIVPVEITPVVEITPTVIQPVEVTPVFAP